MKQRKIFTLALLFFAGTTAFADGIHTGTVHKIQTHDGGSVYFKLSGQSQDEWFYISSNWGGAKVMISNLLTAKSMGLTVKAVHHDATVFDSPVAGARHREIKMIEVE